MANPHRKRNNINRIRIGGDWLNGTEEVRTCIVNAFNVLSDLGDWRASPKGLNFSRLNDTKAIRLEVSFTEEEVRAALAYLNGDKAPRSNGFTTAFWQFSWDVVKSDIMGLLRDFHEQGSFVRSLNSTFMVLIPKRGGAEDLKDFKPISLTGNIYKLIAKVLANRLKKVMNKSVNSTQISFVEGRQILDASLIANEVIDSILKKQDKGVLCKLDIKKAYDQINWNFLTTVLIKMGFKEKWSGYLKYGIEDGGWFSNTPRGSYGAGLWKDICKEVIQMRQNCSFEVGNERKVRFWEDV